MITEIFKNIYRIDVPLKGNPLKAVNCYFIRGDESDLLIDTGFRSEDCRRVLLDALNELGSEKARRDVAVTHFHSDHSGLMNEMVGENRSIYVSRRDYDYKRFLDTEGTQKLRDEADRRNGFTQELLDEMRAKSPAWVYTCREWHSINACKLQQDDKIRVGEYELKSIIVPGHTPGNMMLWNEQNKIMFSGDHVLFDITPNITRWIAVKDSLGDYLDSLDKASLYPVERCFPGHRGTGDYQKRISDIKKHHMLRLEECFDVVRTKPGLKAMDIAGNMRWKIRCSSWADFPVSQKGFAVGECCSHLDYLVARGFICCEERETETLYFAR